MAYFTSMRAAIALYGLTTLLLAGRVGTTPPLPDAEGFGAATPGGRRGPVRAVTTLADAGSGSFRAALAAAGPRTVVFRVEGAIALAAPLTITEPFLTID